MSSGTIAQWFSTFPEAESFPYHKPNKKHYLDSNGRRKSEKADGSSISDAGGYKSFFKNSAQDDDTRRWTKTKTRFEPQEFLSWAHRYFIEQHFPKSSPLQGYNTARSQTDKDHVLGVRGGKRHFCPLRKFPVWATRVRNGICKYPDMSYRIFQMPHVFLSLWIINKLLNKKKIFFYSV